MTHCLTVTLAIAALFAGLVAFSLSSPRNAKIVRKRGFEKWARLSLKLAGAILLLVSFGASLSINPQLGALYWCAGFAACGLAMTAFYSARS